MIIDMEEKFKIRKPSLKNFTYQPPAIQFASEEERERFFHPTKEDIDRSYAKIQAELMQLRQINPNSLHRPTTI